MPAAAVPALPAALPVSRLLLVGTGAAPVAHLPTLVEVLRFSYGVDVRVALTAAAARLVSAEALRAFSGRPVLGPGWPAGGDAAGGGSTSAGAPGAAHVRAAAWPDVVVVWPATLDFLARCATGLGSDLPAAIVLSTAAPVVFAPSLPGAAAGGGPYLRAVRTLRDDGHLVLPTCLGTSLSSQPTADGAVAPPHELLHALAHLPRPPRGAGTAVTPTASEEES